MKAKLKFTDSTAFWFKVLCVFLAIIIGFSMLAGMVHTGFGSAKIYDISYMTQEGAYQRALLYIPKTATSENPAPAIVACHGYNNTAEVQDINAIELSRRGYVVIAPDCYGHGLSGQADATIPAPAGGGVYSALQYLGTLPYVDAGRIGMVGHSMGGMNIQKAAAAAFEKQKIDPSIVVPQAIIPTAAPWYLNAENTDYLLGSYPVNVGCIFGAYDEFVKLMWGIDNAAYANQTPQAIATVGIENVQYDSWYRYGQDAVLSREDAVAAAKDFQLRGLFQPAVVHPIVHFSEEAVNTIVEFFDITLRSGESSLPAGNQIWIWKHIFSGIAMLGFLFVTVPIGALLLQAPFFRTLVRPEPTSCAVMTDKASRRNYWVLYILCMLPAPLLAYLCMSKGGLLGANTFVNNVFPLAAVNGIFILNIVTALISLIIFAVLYLCIYKKNGASFDKLGVKLPLPEILKALLLAVISFGCAYLLLEIVDTFFLVDFRFWVFSFRTMTPARWSIWLRYLPNYALFFLVSALTLNMTTRVEGKSELTNTLLIFVGSALGLLVLCLLDYGVLFATGVKLFPVAGGSSTNLSGILLWGVIFILPLASLVTRFFFKKTGSIWVGGFINALMVTLFAVSNTVVSMGALY